MAASASAATEGAAAEASFSELPAEVFPVRDGYMMIQAEGGMEYKESDGIYHLYDGVKISFASYVIETERISIDREQKSVVADMPFKMDVGRLVFEGESFRYYYEEESGNLGKVTSSIDGANFQADSVEFGSARGILMKNVIASTCCLENMEYHVEAKTVELLPDNRARFKGLSLYFKGRKIFKWPSYTMKLGEYGEASSGAAVGGWFFSAPTLGYSDFGGMEAKTEIKHISAKNKMVSGLYLDYFAGDGLFTEARVDGIAGEGYRYSVRYGKQYKENTGYFRYFPPVIVWNSPVMEFEKEETVVAGSRLRLKGRFEIGRLREERMSKPLDRAFLNIQAKYPLSSQKRAVRFALLGDARYGVYRTYREYRLWGNGLEMTVGDENDRALRLQYMSFRNAGRTPFASDIVNTNTKLFGYGILKLSGRNALMVDAQYDMDSNKFDEVVYSAIRDSECLRFYVSWKSELKRVGLSLQVLTPGRK